MSMYLRHKYSVVHTYSIFGWEATNIARKTMYTNNFIYDERSIYRVVGKLLRTFGFAAVPLGAQTWDRSMFFTVYIDLDERCWETQ